MVGVPGDKVSSWVTDKVKGREGKRYKKEIQERGKR